MRRAATCFECGRSAEMARRAQAHLRSAMVRWAPRMLLAAGDRLLATAADAVG